MFCEVIGYGVCQVMLCNEFGEIDIGVVCGDKKQFSYKKFIVGVIFFQFFICFGCIFSVDEFLLCFWFKKKSIVKYFEGVV